MQRTKLKVKILSWLLSFLMVFTVVPAYAAETVSGNDVPNQKTRIAGNEIPVNDNVIDITDRTIGSVSSYYGKAVSVTIGGASVRRAYEDGLTIYVVLGSDTVQDAEISTTFNTSTNKFTVEGTTASLTLSGGTGEVSQKLDAKYNGRLSRGTATYKLVFECEEIPTEVPVRLQEVVSTSTYAGVSLDLDVSQYFDKASDYYLVEGEDKTALEGRTYTFLSYENGEHTLTFAASNMVGECQDYVTVMVTVSAIESGIWIGKESSNGSMNYVQFYDGDGNEIDGLQVTLEGTTIHAVLPKDYSVSGTVKACFHLTQSGDIPFITTKTGVSGPSSGKAVSNKFTEKNITLSAGAATLTFYYYNVTPDMRNNNYETWTLKFSMINELPVLAGDSSASARVEAGKNYELDLSGLFTDADGDSLTYQYKVDDGAWADCDAQFTYSNDLSGEYALSIRAFDSKGYSEEIYTVNLTVEDSKETYRVQVNVPEGLVPEFYVSDETGTVGNPLTATATNNVYTVDVPGNVSYISWRADGMGMSCAVSANSELSLVKTCFKVMAGEAVDTGAAVTVKYGDGAAVGNANSFLLLSGVTYDVNATASASGFNGGALTDYVPVSGERIINLVQKHFTVIAPAGSVVSAGTLNGSFGYHFSTPISVVTEGDTVTYKFTPLGTNAFIRVQRPGDPDAVTYWDYESSKADGKVITVTEEMLFMNDNGDFDSDTVYRNFEKYALDLGDIYLNINSSGYINLSVGDTRQLNSFRNWQAIESFTNAMIALPDFSYEIITLEGEDVVTIEPNANNSAMAMLTAKNEGTVIVLVTYDAMYSELTATGSGGGAGGANRLSAIWPDRTGVFVVSVGKDGTGIATNMTCNGKTFDAEHSPQFYTGTAGASVSFKPENGCVVTVNRSTVGEETLSFGEFTADGVTVADDGSVTVAGLTTGRHIIRVEKNGVYTYQVVTAQQVTVDIKDADGNTVTEDDVLNAGENVTITVTGLTSPAEKLATAYNFNWQLSYFDQNGNAYKNSSGSSYGRYDFSSTPQVLTVTIPADWSFDSMTLNGYIVAGGFGGKEIGGHRGMGYNGSGMANGTNPVGVNLGTLPEITLKVKPAPVPATGVTLDKETAKLRVTQKLTLVAELTPENTTEKAVWTSSDETIATVENGVITAKAVGTVTITVAVGEHSAQCVVTVNDPIAVTEVRLNQTSAKLESGKLLYLSATVAPEDATDKTVTWTSSNEDVATVDANGVVTTKAEGTAVITAKAGSITAECTVIVEDKEDIDNTVSVYLSISHDATFLKPADSNKVMALQKVDVPYFDLSLYGLDAYKIPETNADYGKVTAMHLYIYATEVFYCGIDTADAGKGYLYTQGILGTDVLTITGSVGSSYMNKFWGYDENLNYYLNYQYPTYAGTTIGATADRIVLSDGDIVTVGHFDNWAFYDDPSSVFNYITVVGGSATVAKNETISLQVYRAGADMGNGGSNTPVESELDVYYTKAGVLTSGDVTTWNKLGTTDESGKLTITLSDFELGEYIVAVAGRYGEVNTREICSAPGGVLLTVNESDEPSEPGEPGEPGAPGEPGEPSEPDAPGEPGEPSEPDAPSKPSEPTNYKNIFKTTGDYLEALAKEYGLTVNSIGGEWIVIGLERADRDIPDVAAYYQEVVKFVKENINDKEQLHRAKSTENARLILALTALGYDVSNVDGHNLLVGLIDMSFVKKQGINGPIWALIAFDSHNYEIPAGGDVTREGLVETILDKQLEDGGWALSGVKADADMTGMALTALAPYYSTNADVKIAVDHALACLSVMQHDDGGFGSVDGACAESAAQVIVALTALGIDPHTDVRFIKNNRSVLDALCDYYVEGDGFKHVAFLEVNGMATEQSYYALTAYVRFLENKSSLYDMSDVVITNDNIGDNTGGSTDDNTGGSTDDNIGGGTDESTGESTDESTGESTDDSTGGNTGDSDSDGDNTSESTEGNNGDSTEENAGDATEDNPTSGEIEIITPIVPVNPSVPSKLIAPSENESDDETKEEADLTPSAEAAKELLETLDSKSQPEKILDAILAYEELSKEEKEDLQSDERVEEVRAQLAEMLQTDSKTGIAVSGTEWNIRIVVDDIIDAKEIQTMKEKLNGHTMLGHWDIYLKDAKTGKEVQPDGSVMIKIPLALLGDYSAFDGLAVVHYADDGTVEYLSSTMNEEFITFKTVEFSYYAVIGYMGTSPLDNLADDVISDDVNKVGAPVLPWVIGGGCGLVLLAAILFLIMKNKKVKVM